MQYEPTSISQVTLAILAGGQGSRMGMPKGELRVAGEPILRYLLDRFDWPGPTLLVTAPGREHPPGWGSFTREAADPVAGMGPLRGVLTALENAGTEQVLITPLDMPGLASEQLLWLASAFGTEQARRDDLVGMMTCRGSGDVERRTEPFPAMFHRDAGRIVRDRLAAGRLSVHALTDAPGFVVVPAPAGWSPATWVNLNRPADLRAWLETPLNRDH